MLDWLVQGLATNWLYGVLVFLTGGAAFWSKLKSHRFASPAFYAVIAMAAMAVFLYAFNAQRAFVEDQRAKTSTDNIGARVRDWLDAFGITIKRTNSIDNHFGYVVTMQNGNSYDVVRPKDRDRYIMITSQLVLGRDLGVLSNDQVSLLVQAVSLELARGRINYVIHDQSRLRLERRIPITPSLSEGEFISSLDIFDNTTVAAQVVARTTMASMTVANRGIRKK